MLAALMLTMFVGAWRPALAAPGDYSAWGRNGNGQLGDGTTDSKNSPIPVTLASGVSATAVSGGGFHSLAVGSDGQVYAWGANGNGQLGDGTTDNKNTPVAVTLASGVSATAVSGGSSHSLAVGSDGQVYAWGSNSQGRLGDGGTTTQRNSPVAVTLASGVSATAVSGGGSHSLAVGSDGQVYAWGSNGQGRLGDGTTTQRNSPVAVTLASGVSATAVSAGNFHSLAVGSNGKVYAWGFNGNGQLGDGTTDNKNSPIAVTLASGVSATAVSAGNAHSLAVGSDGKVYAWGANSQGRLGDGTTDNKLSPVAVTLASGVSATAVSAGFAHSLAVGSDGKVYAWGANGDGQLGDGTTDNKNTPVAVTLSATDVEAGNNHSLAIPVAAVAPTITSFTPPSGRVGTVVTITGTGFTGATAVSFNNTPAASFTVDSATQITATVAANTTTGRISVTTPGGTATSADDFTVTPLNGAPTLDPTIKPAAPGPNDLVITDPRGTDPENDPLTFTFAYAINGTTVAGETDKPNRVDLSKYPALATPGAVLTVTFTAFDGQNTVSVTRAVTIAAPPVANPTSGTAKAGVQSTIGPITGTDPNGLSLRYVLLTQPTSGSAFFAGSADNVQLYYTSARTFSGADSVTFQVVNSEGRRSDPATISITVQGNGAPIAFNNSMTVKAGVRTEIPLVASDPDGDELRYRITRQPANGSAFLANNSSGGVSLFYTSRATYSGADSVQFTVTDTSGATSAPGTISLTVVGNSAPTADATTLDAISGERASVLLSGNDPDGDALVRYRITKQPTNGSAFLAGSGSNVQLYYTSQAGYSGSDSVAFTVTDSTGRTSAPATVSITVSPAPNAARSSADAS